MASKLNRKYDAVIVGSGPNGLAAGIRLAQAGRSVVIFESSVTAGGGMRSDTLTLPGFSHDVCSAAHPLAVASPFFRSLPLHEHGLKWIHSPLVVAHPFDDGTATVLRRSVRETAESLGADSKNYRNVFEPLVSKWEYLMEDTLGPITHFPKHPLLLARFGMQALHSAQGFTHSHFTGEKAQALFGGVAAHSSAQLTGVASAAVGLILQIAGHAVGWPIPAGGSQKLAESLISYFKSLGGELVTSHPVTSLDELPSSDSILFDLTPRQILKIAGDALEPNTRKSLASYKYGPGVFKMDWALSSPIPWKARETGEAATVHLGGTLEELTASEKVPVEGKISQNPFVLLCQPSLFDTSRAPEGKHTAWAYCHVPHNCTIDMTEIIEKQIERFAPGFSQVILKRRVLTPQDLEKRNSNLIGGDIFGGLVNAKQLFFRPTGFFDPYTLPGKSSLFICSSSTPPGPGVHGMCGFHCALAVLRTSLRKSGSVAAR